VDPPGAHVDDLRLAVRGIRDDPRLAAGERDRLVTEVVNRHRGQRARDSLADRDQHVELAGLGARRNLVGEADEVVGRVTHRREDGDDARSFLMRGHDSGRHVLEFLRVADRSAAELHHHSAGAGRRFAGDGGDRFVVGRGHRVKCRRASRAFLGCKRVRSSRGCG
jgi:hypothetical protein